MRTKKMADIESFATFVIALMAIGSFCYVAFGYYQQRTHNQLMASPAIRFEVFGDADVVGVRLRNVGNGVATVKTVRAKMRTGGQWVEVESKSDLLQVVLSYDITGRVGLYDPTVDNAVGAGQTLDFIRVPADPLNDGDRRDLRQVTIAIRAIAIEVDCEDLYGNPYPARTGQPMPHDTVVPP